MPGRDDHAVEQDIDPRLERRTVARSGEPQLSNVPRTLGDARQRRQAWASSIAASSACNHARRAPRHCAPDAILSRERPSRSAT
jgi:hypothetical protein